MQDSMFRRFRLAEAEIPANNICDTASDNLLAQTALASADRKRQLTDLHWRGGWTLFRTLKATQAREAASKRSYPRNASAELNSGAREAGAEMVSIILFYPIESGMGLRLPFLSYLASVRTC